ncbi:hypothetical protein I3760_05G070700 [Carya illinoinensis]|nr:hypothetical protein I3760_05G070700 [Carya illinoinensis]
MGISGLFCSSLEEGIRIDAKTRQHRCGFGFIHRHVLRIFVVAVDLSDESAYAVRWAVHHYIRPSDAVILLHVSPTSILFGSIDLSISSTEVVDEGGTTTTATKASEQKVEDDFDAFTALKAADLARSLREAQIPYKVHIVKDHDMRERLCLEVERLGLNAVIMGSKGFGAARRGRDSKLCSVSDYCVHHRVCPVVVVRYLDDGDGGMQAVVDAKEEDFFWGGGGRFAEKGE